MYFTFFPLLILCFEILGKHSFFAVSLENENKPSFFKVKLSKEEFSADLKAKKKPISSGPERVGELKLTSTLSWDDVEAGFTPPTEYANDTVEMDTHTYYNSTFYSDPKDGKLLWIDIDTFPKENIITHGMLSNSHRQATTVALSFDFPFYGLALRNITIATGGFLYMGDYLHNWIAATQYIAPLMANFDTTISNKSTIKYADNGTRFTVQWDQVYIQDRQSDGAFTFQVNLFESGDISFAYKEIPFPINNISDTVHPVKIGFSDAYIHERTTFFIRRKTIYEYHRVDLLAKKIDNGTGVYFHALPTCLNYKDCESCIAADSLECEWCVAVQRCSDGVDRLRQSWITSSCLLQQTSTCSAAAPEAPKSISTQPPAITKAPTESTSSQLLNIDNSPKDVTHKKETLNSDVTPHPYIQENIEERVSVSISPGAIATIVVFIAIVLGIGVWIFYAYRFPQSTSGQFLIKYRPTQWSMKSESRDNNSSAFNM